VARPIPAGACNSCVIDVRSERRFTHCVEVGIYFANIAVLQLLYSESTTAEWLFP
jgi:hypothetical protein